MAKATTPNLLEAFRKAFVAPKTKVPVKGTHDGQELKGTITTDGMPRRFTKDGLASFFEERHGDSVKGSLKVGDLATVSGVLVPAEAGVIIRNFASDDTDAPSAVPMAAAASKN